MANICSFKMKVIGDNAENLKTFFEMLTQMGNTWMGRGGESHIVEETHEDKHIFVIDGWCKWSLKASLILDAIHMREKPENWTFGRDKNVKEMRFLTLPEACKELNLTMEAYSSEPGCEFQEHVSFIDGEYSEEITHYTEEWDDEEGDFVSTGGFKWVFNI